MGMLLLSAFISSFLFNDQVVTYHDLMRQLEEDRKQVITVTTNLPEKPIDKVYTDISDRDKELLAKLVYAEARGEKMAGKIAVAVVVLNRVDSGKFPNTVKGVIYQRGQFSPVSNGSINNSYDQESYEAVLEALKIDRTSDRSLFFYNPKTATSRWLDSRPTVKVIGNHTFKE